MAYVRKRGGRWYIGVKDDSGQWREQVVAVKSKTQAWALAEELERKSERVRLGLDVALVRMTLREVAEAYLPIARARRAGTKGGLHASRVLDSRLRVHVLPALGKRNLHDIRPSDVDVLLAAKAAEGFSPSTLRHIQITISTLFRYATDQLRAYQGPNPGRACSRIEVPERAPRFIDAGSVGHFLACVPDQWRGMFAVAVYTGLRKGEIYALKVSDVDAERNTLAVSGSYDGTTKSGKVRPVPIPAGLWPYLKKELGTARSVWLFPRPTDGKQRSPDTNVGRVMRIALRKAGMIEGYDHLCRRRAKYGHPETKCGFVVRRADNAPSRCPKCNMKLWVRAVPIKLSFKDLRSTFGTAVYEATGDIRAAQRLLGHSDVRVTEQRYAHARASRLQEFVDGIDFGQPLAGRVPETKPQTSDTEGKDGAVVRLKSEGIRGHGKQR